MPIFLPRRWNRQPPYNAGVDWNNPLTRSLAFATQGGTYQAAQPYRQMTRTGTTIDAAQSGMVNGFGSTLGVGTTDSIITPLTAHNATRTYVVRVLRNGGGGGTAGRVFEKRTAGGQVELLYWSNSTADFRYSRAFSSTTGEWVFPVSVSATTPTTLAVSYNSGSTSNDPVFYANGTSVAVTETLTPVGTLVNNTDAYVLGNRTNDNARNWDGWIGEFFVWDRILSAAEIAEVSRNPWQLFRPAANQTFYSLPSQGGAFSLSLDAGSYNLTGQTLGLTSARSFGLDAGSYTLTGRDVTLAYSAGTVSYTLSLDAGSYSLTGRDVGTSFGRSLTLDSGTYNLSGQPIAFNVTLNMLLDSGAYNLTGRIVGLTWSGETPVEITDRIVTLRSLTERWRM